MKKASTEAQDVFIDIRVVNRNDTSKSHRLITNRKAKKNRN